MVRRVLLSVLVAVGLSGCTVDRSGLGGDEPSGDAGGTDGEVPGDAEPSHDTGPRDTGPGDDDAGPGEDACVAAAEACNDRDDDCDGDVDEDASDATSWYQDADGDAFGVASTEVVACDAPGPGYIATAGDCDDGAASINPAASEACNGVDVDCSGLVDDGDAMCPCQHRRRDADGHSYLFCAFDRDWHAARDYCEGNGYALVVVGDHAENDWVWGEASSIDDGDWWIGLRDVGDDRYQWVDGNAAWSGGSASGYTHFRDGYPDGSGPCVEMGDDVVDGRAGAWNDVECDQETYFICEQR